MTLDKTQIEGILKTFCDRADWSMHKAAGANNSKDVVKFTAFASTLEWAAREVRVTAGIREARRETEAVARESTLADAAHDTGGIPGYDRAGRRECAQARRNVSGGCQMAHREGTEGTRNRRLAGGALASIKGKGVARARPPLGASRTGGSGLPMSRSPGAARLKTSAQG